MFGIDYVQAKNINVFPLKFFPLKLLENETHTKTRNFNNLRLGLQYIETLALHTAPLHSTAHLCTTDSESLMIQQKCDKTIYK